MQGNRDASERLFLPGWNQRYQTGACEDIDARQSKCARTILRTRAWENTDAASGMRESGTDH
eukprot:556432-Alexandrium_andersonii.AAC.1